MKNPDVSVLLCTRDRQDFLSDILERLISQNTEERFSFEIVVVDNGSTDGSRMVVERLARFEDPEIRYVFDPIEGISKVRNRSIREARGRWLAFIDDDELPEQDWLLTFWNAAIETGAKFLGSVVRVEFSDEQKAELGPESRRSLRDGSEFICSDILIPYDRRFEPGSGNMMVERGVFETVGVFDETMTMGGGDFDFARRARRAGFVPWYVPGAVVEHRIGAERLTLEAFRIDSLQSGALLAFMSLRYRGPIGFVSETIARVAQGLIVTFPLILKAKLYRDKRDLLDRRIKCWRMKGFVRYILAICAPNLRRNSDFIRGLDFHRNRYSDFDRGERRKR